MKRYLWFATALLVLLSCYVPLTYASGDDWLFPTETGVVQIGEAMRGFAERTEDDSPATMMQFMRDLLLILGLNTSFNLDYVRLTDAFISDGHWIRVLLVDRFDMYMLLLMDSEEQDAVVNEVHVINLQNSHQEFEELSSACAIAAEGMNSEEFQLLIDNPDNLTSFNSSSKCYELIYESRETKTILADYERSIIKARKPSDVIFADKTESGDDSVFSIDSACTLEQFIEKWEWINQTVYNGIYGLENTGIDHLENGNTVFYADVANSILLAYLLEDKTHINDITIFNLEENPPEAVTCGMVALCAVSQMPTFLMSVAELVWLEHSYWDELLEMQPVEAYNGAILYVDEGEIDSKYHPIARIVMEYTN